MNNNELKEVSDRLEAIIRPDRRTCVCDVRFAYDGQNVVITGEISDLSLHEHIVKFSKELTGTQVLDKITILPTSELQNTMGLVSVSVGSIYREPAHNSPLLTQALLGTPANVLKRQGSWTLVQLPDRYIGWIDQKFSIISKPSYQHWVDKEKIIITAFCSSARSTVDPKSPPISDLVAGDILIATGEDKEHYFVQYPDGREGVVDKAVSQSYKLWLESVSATPETIVDTALLFMGIPYLWGGTSTKAVDCSGFVKLVFQLNGIALPRDADQQAGVGLSIVPDSEMANVNPGDLLFFGNGNSITHVGISLGGKRFIHASGDVHINSFDPNDAFFLAERARTFMGIKRILGAPLSTGVHTIRNGIAR